MCGHDWNRGSGHDPLQSFYDRYEDVEEFFKWCFVRNPWDRIVSAHVRCTGRIQPIDPKWNDFATFIRAWHGYRDRIKNLETLNWHSMPRCEDFDGSMKVHFFPQLPLLKANGKMCMDFVGRFENMEEDWGKVCGLLGVAGKLKHTNARKSPVHYKKYYTDELKELVADLYEEDIKEFGYEF